jgi:hypothetical protein
MRTAPFKIAGCVYRRIIYLECSEEKANLKKIGGKRSQIGAGRASGDPLLVKLGRWSNGSVLAVSKLLDSPDTGTLYSAGVAGG